MSHSRETPGRAGAAWDAFYAADFELRISAGFWYQSLAAREEQATGLPRSAAWSPEHNLTMWSATMMESSVWDRRETKDTLISPAAYNFVIGATLLWGFGINFLMVNNLDPGLAFAFGRWTFFILYFVSCFGGIYLFNSSDQPVVSFIGYNLVVVPFGFIVNAVVSQYDPAIVLEAVQTTGMVTLIMMILGSTYPAFFEKISGALTAALFAVIIVEMIGIFFFDAHPGVLDWIVAAIFCGYIGYDWGRANSIPKTVDNGIDSAASLYMDIINLFLRILRIMGSRR